MRKHIIIALILFLVSLFQQTFLVHFTRNGAFLNPLLFLIFYFSFFSVKNKNYALFAGLVGGLSLDIFSSLFFGIFTLLMMATVSLIKTIKPFFETKRIMSFLLAWAITLFFYYGVLSLINYECRLCFTIFDVIYNFFFGIIIYLFLRFVYVPIERWIKK